MLSYTT